MAARTKAAKKAEKTKTVGRKSATKKVATKGGRSRPRVGSYLTEPDGVRLKPEQKSPQVRAL